YQPKVDVASRAVVGVEALVRWDHPTRGLLPPAAFLPLVEDAGMMHELTIAVLEQSLDQVARWREAGRTLPVAVNLSPSSLVDVRLRPRAGLLLRPATAGGPAQQLARRARSSVGGDQSVTLPAIRRAAASPDAGAVFTVIGCDEIAAFDRDIDALALRCGAPV